MSTDLLVQAFGRFSPHPARLNHLGREHRGDFEADERLWRQFRDRGKFMGWSSYEQTEDLYLWNLHEAELTYHLGGEGLGFAQVGLGLILWDPSRRTDPTKAIPALVQCMHDSLSWFGEIEVSAVQVSGDGINPREVEAAVPFTTEVLGWFDVPLSSPVEAVISLASARQCERLMSNIATIYQDYRKRHTEPFHFAQLVDLQEQYAAGPDWGGRVQWDRSAFGIPVTMPEWTPASIGWMIADVYDVALSLDVPPQHLAVRLTRLPDDD